MGDMFTDHAADPSEYLPKQKSREALDQDSFLACRLRDAMKADKRWAKLLFELKKAGGEDSRIVPVPEPDLGLLLANGHDMYQSKVVLKRGIPNQCHENAARLWLEGKADAIGVGWALSDDTLWRQHSWGMRGREVLETTSKRIRYWGVELSGKFAMMHAWPYLQPDEREKAVERSEATK